MRLTVTAVSPTAGIRTDVVIDADPQARAGELAADLAALLGGGPAARPGDPGNVISFPSARQAARSGAEPGLDRGTAVLAALPLAAGPALYIDGRRVPPDQAVAESPLRPGCVISLGDPSGCLPPEPTGVVEVRVVSGPGAGTVRRISVGTAEIGPGEHAAIRLGTRAPFGSGQYPPAGYPPAGYPPGQHPADQYPPGAHQAAQYAPAPYPPAGYGHAQGQAGPVTAAPARPGRPQAAAPSRPAAPAAPPVAGPAAPGAALRLIVDPRGTCQLVPDAGVPATLDGAPVTAPADWRPGQQLAVYGSLLELAPYEPPDAALRLSQDGAGLDFNRPPRLLPPVRETRFQLPVPPTRGERRPLPILMAVIPVVMGVGLAYAIHEVYMLAMCALSPVTMIGNYFTDRKQGRKSYTARMAEYREHRARIETDARDALAAEQAARRADCPDPATVLTIATGPRRRLWERRRSDPDFLVLRLGIADLPSAVELRDPTQDEHRQRVFWEIHAAPVTVGLRDRGVIGVAGPGSSPRAIGRWLVAQMAALQSPNDVQVYLLTDSSGQDSWEWARWLPHCQHPGGGGATLIGNDAETVTARIAELLAMIKDRQRAAAESDNRQAAFQQASVIIVFDGSRRMRSLPGVIQLLREGPPVGVYSICLDSDERLLPAECQAVATVLPAMPQPGMAEPDGGLRVQQAGAMMISQARPDQVAPDWCLRVSRSLAPIRDISDDEDGFGLPESSRLLDVLGLEPPAAGAVMARWAAGGRSTTAVVGESYDGPFGIDLRRDGPHGLIAGTTGAGKSELLQTIVATLAVANRPDAMTFVLVDYKGGSAFKDCVSLPHTVGMVTDLDTHLVSRALESLSAELTRREHMLADAGAKDIEDYTVLQDRDGRLAPLPRLLIVIDEFASMARELPDFVTGLVNIAQRGRSLGIHLILATQRPSGVVSPEIRANTNLRIALRVTDPGESTDVIDAPDSAHISKSTPGRAYVRLGHSSLIPFQTGRVGGRRPGAVAVTESPWLVRTDWAQAGRAAPDRPAARAGEIEEVTDLKVLVAAIREASGRLGIPAQHSPWLAPLPTDLLLRDIPRPAAARRPAHHDAAAVLPPAPYGITDLPAEQSQRAAVIDLESFGHMMAAGAPRSGRSQLLRTIGGSLAATHSTADVHLYGIDCGNGALLPLADLPHCGAVVLRTQAERAARLIGRLGQELSRRQEQLAGGGFAGIGEQRAAASAEGAASVESAGGIGGTGGTEGGGPAGALPHIVILLDRWEGFTASLGDVDGGRLQDVLTRILGEGASAGMHLIMTGDRSLIAGRISSLTDDKVAFRLPDRDDFNLIGLRPRQMPEAIAPGRTFRSGSGIETQVALLAPDASGPGQAAALREIAEQSSRRDEHVPHTRRPFRVDLLPARLSFADAWPLRDAAAPPRPLWALVGIGGDELAAYGPDLADGPPAFIVGGPAKSGRSTVLATMTRSFLAAGTQVVLVTPRPSPLRALAAEPGVLRLFEGPELPGEGLREALAALTGPGVVIIDDAEVLRDCDAADDLRKIVNFGGNDQRGLVFGGNAEDICGGFSGWQVEARRARRGCLLTPQQITDGDLIGTRLSRSMIGEPVRPGKALLNVGDGNLITVAVPVG
jgi:DNA segregation ATPase FtsK/SpoIIIE, S-DNA-T family